MAIHDNLEPEVHPSEPKKAVARPESLCVKPTVIAPSIALRKELVQGLIQLAEHHRMVLVRGTPASGKTTLRRLITNELLATRDVPVHVLVGWKQPVVQKIGWRRYLEKATGINGEDWFTTPAFLLFDEARESFWDEDLWMSFFKELNANAPLDYSARVIAFSSFGSPNRGNQGLNMLRYHKTPPFLGPDKIVSMRPEESRLHILLTYCEAKDMVAKQIKATGPPMTSQLVDRLIEMSQGHAGALAALMLAVCTAPDLRDLRQRDQPFELADVQSRLFGRQERMLSLIGNHSFCRGMPLDEHLQDKNIAQVLKHAVATGTFAENSLPSSLHGTLELIHCNGWLHEERGKRGSSFSLPSHLHRWLLGHMLLDEKTGPSQIPFHSALHLAISSVKGFIPRSLSDPPRSVAGGNDLLEDQYQKEFYRALHKAVDAQVAVSPEFVAKHGKGGGAIDFLVPATGWGFELLRNRIKVDEHMGRFEHGGQYYDLLRSGIMSDYVVLDFSTSRPKKARPQYAGHLYHILFTGGYRNVDVLDASDLTVFSSFALTENENPITWV